MHARLVSVRLVLFCSSWLGVGTKGTGKVIHVAYLLWGRISASDVYGWCVTFFFPSPQCVKNMETRFAAFLPELLGATGNDGLIVTSLNSSLTGPVCCDNLWCSCHAKTVDVVGATHVCWVTLTCLPFCATRAAFFRVCLIYILGRLDALAIQTFTLLVIPWHALLL